MNFAELKQITDSFMACRALQVACSLRLFDILASESRTAKGIADALKTDQRATGLLCNALAGMGLLEKSNGRFSNTETSQKYLVTSAPLYYGWIIRHMGRLWNSWGKLPESIKTGNPAARPGTTEGQDRLDMEAFIMGMHSVITARGDVERLAECLDLKEAGSMLDLGGGPATFSIGLCQRFKALKATVFDLPEAIKIAGKNLARCHEVEGRIRLLEGDFLKDDLPAGFDLVLISNVIHMMNEEQNGGLMGKVHRSLNPGGRIVIKDHILNEDLTRPVHGALFSLHMLLHTGGRDYSFNEIRGWLDTAGFTKISLLKLPSDSPYGVVVGTNTLS